MPRTRSFTAGSTTSGPGSARRFELPRRRWIVPVALVAILLVGFALRTADLRADPPPDLSWSFGPYTDEGLNTYSARNLVLYGALKTDDFFPFVVYPLFSYLVALVFSLFGTGLISVKIISLLAGLGSILVLYYLVRDSAGRLAGLIAALLIAVSYPMVMYTRLGLVESLQILFLLLTGLCWTRGMKHPLLMALSGFFAASSILLIKVSAVFIMPVMLVMVVLLWIEVRSGHTTKTEEPVHQRVYWLFFVAGIGVAVAAWLALVVIPYSRDYLSYILRHSFESPAGNPKTIIGYLFNTFTVGASSRLFPKLAFVAGFGFLLLPGLSSSRSAGFRYLLAWFVFGLLMLGYMNYRPPRYEVIILPPLIAAASVGIARLIEQGTLLPAPCRGWLLRIGWTIWLVPLATQLLIYTRGFWGLVRPRHEAEMVGAGLITAIILGIMSPVILRRLRTGLSLQSVFGRIILAGFFLILVFRLDLAQFARWYENRTHNIIRYSRELDAILPEDAVLAGGWAPALLAESHKRALCLTDWANIDDPVGRFGMTHLVSHEDNDIRLLEPAYPALREHLRPIWQGSVRGTRLTAFELTRPGGR